MLLLLGHFLIFLFASASWIGINVVYVELPILAQIAPEGWDLPSYIVLTIQISCIAPLLYSIVATKWPKQCSRVESLLVGILLCFLGCALVAISFVYEDRTTIFGAEHSAWFLVCLLFVCIPCTMSDVLFLPIMSKWPPRFISTFFVGMGAGALMPSLLAFAQGDAAVSRVSSGWSVSARISLPAFLYIHVAAVIAAAVAFALLLRLSRHPDESVKEKEETAASQESDTRFIVCMAALNFCLGAAVNSVIPVVLPYAAGGMPQHAYHTANTLFVLANPLFSSALLIIPVPRRTSVIMCLSLLCFFPTCLLVCMAAGWKRDSGGWTVALIASSVLSSGFITLLRTASAGWMRLSPNPKALFITGAATQAGSFVGALAMFLLANVGKVFPTAN